MTQLAQGLTVLVLSQLASPGEALGTAPAIITQVMPDVVSGNLTPSGTTPVLCDVFCMPWARLLTFNVYDKRSNGGNATLDQHGFAFLVDDTVDVQSIVPSRLAPKR